MEARAATVMPGAGPASPTRTAHRAVRARALRPLLVAAGATFLQGCAPDHRIEMELSPGHVVSVSAVGEAPLLSVVNIGPGRIEVTFDPGGPAQHGPFQMPADSVMAWSVSDPRQVCIAATFGAGTIVRVRALRADGMEATLLSSPAVGGEGDPGAETLGQAPLVPEEQSEAPAAADPYVDPDAPLPQYEIEPHVPATPPDPPGAGTPGEASPGASGSGGGAGLQDHRAVGS
jgi:hypothetical protein